MYAIRISYSYTRYKNNTVASGVPESEHCSTLKHITLPRLNMSYAAKVLMRLYVKIACINRTQSDTIIKSCY